MRAKLVLLVDAVLHYLHSNNNIYCKCLYGTSQIFCCRESQKKSQKDTTQGDPTAMGAYVLGVTPLIRFLSKFVFTVERKSKQVAFAENFTVAGKASTIKAYWIYYNNKCLCLTTSPNHPSHI